MTHMPWGALRIVSMSRFNSTKQIFLYVSATVVLGIVVLGALYQRSTQLLRGELLQRARIVKNAVDLKHLRQLSGTSDDINHSAYLSLKRQLGSMKAADGDCRFIYLMGINDDGQVFFYVDNETVGSAEEAPAGLIYEEVSPEYLKAFEEKTERVVGPVEDRWGVWVTALIPVFEPESGRLLAVLGMDQDADQWGYSVFVSMTIPALAMLLVVSLVLVGILSRRRVRVYSPKPVQRHFMTALILIITVLISGFVAVLFLTQRSHLAQDSGRMSLNLAASISNRMEKQSNLLGAVQSSLLINDEILEAFAARDRDGILSLSQPLFKELEENYKITHMYFTDTNRVNLLRVHFPQRMGDTINRFTTLEAQRLQQRVSGLEVGPLGTLTIRVVSPVLYKNELIGYSELGREVDFVLNNIAYEHKLEYVIAVHKHVIENTDLKSGMKMLGRIYEWDRYENSVLIKNSPPVDISPWISAEAHSHGNVILADDVQNRQWRVIFSTARDITGREVGDYIFFQDVTRALGTYYSFMLSAIGLAIIILLSLLYYLYNLLKSTDRGIEKQQQELGEIADRYNKLAQQSQIFTWEVNREGVYTYVNEVVHSMTGFDPEDLIYQKHFYDLHPEEGRDAFKNGAFAAFGAKQAFEKLLNPIQRKDGTIIWVETSGLPMLNESGELTGYRGSDIDVTRQKELEETRERERTKLKQILHTIPDGVYIVDQDCQLEYINPAVEQEFGPINGQKCHQYFHDSAEVCEWCKLPQTSQGDVVRKDWVSQKTGKYYEMYDMPLYNADGSISKLDIYHDVTENRKLEQERQSLQEQLYQAQKLEAVGTMVGGVAHEFNNLLQSIFLYTTLSKDLYTEDEDLQSNLDRIAESSERARDLVDQVLTFSRKTKADYAAHVIQEIVENSLEYQRELLPENVSLTQKLDAAEAIVNCDKTQIHQVVTNLCKNAVQALSAEGGTIKISLAIHEEHESNSQILRQFVRLQVQDDGPGMDEDTQSRVFEPFFTTQPIGKGTGLGLSVIHGIVEMMEGKIDLESSEGEGTTFKLDFPLSAGVAKSSDKKAEAETDLPKISILFVDDETDIRDAVQKVFQKKGFLVDVADDGDEGLKLFMAHPDKYQLIITDISMPGVSGFELVRMIRDYGSDIPIFLSTGHLETDRNAAEEEDVNEVIQKPWNVPDILAKIKKYVDPSRL